MLLMSCTNKTMNIKETPTLTDPVQLSITEIEKIGRIKIPSSALDVQTYAVTGWMDDLVLIRFNLPPSDLNSFLENHGFKELKQGYWSIQNAPSSVAWWPKKENYSINPMPVFSGSSLNTPGFSQNILIDMSLEDIYTIYLQCFET